MRDEEVCLQGKSLEFKGLLTMFVQVRMAQLNKNFNCCCGKIENGESVYKLRPAYFLNILEHPRTLLSVTTNTQQTQTLYLNNRSLDLKT